MRATRLACVVLPLLLLGGCRQRRGGHGEGAHAVFQRVGPMVAPRMAPRAAPLAEGRWLITSGTYLASDPDSDTSGCTELFDPVSSAFFELPAMETPRISHALASLPEGDVLVVGGWAKGQPLDTLERFRGGEGRFEALPLRLAKPRSQGLAVPLPGGRVAVFGGLGKEGAPVPEVEVVDLALGKVWVACRLAQPRGAGFQATLLADGTVLVTGGEGPDGAPLAVVERVDPNRGKVEPLAPMAIPRSRHAAVRLEDGGVLLVGGETRDPKTNQRGPEARCERFDPRQGRCLPAPPLPSPRIQPAAARLTDGRVLIAGGWNAEGASSTSLFFDPKRGLFTAGPSLAWGRPDDVVLPLDGGRALVLGSGLEVAELLK